MENLKTFKVKFFGSKSKKTQVQQVKLTVQAVNENEVEDKLLHFHGYEVINGLKIRQQ